MILLKLRIYKFFFKGGGPAVGPSGLELALRGWTTPQASGQLNHTPSRPIRPEFGVIGESEVRTTRRAPTTPRHVFV